MVFISSPPPISFAQIPSIAWTRAGNGTEGEAVRFARVHNVSKLINAVKKSVPSVQL